MGWKAHTHFTSSKYLKVSSAQIGRRVCNSQLLSHHIYYCGSYSRRCMKEKKEGERKVVSFFRTAWRRLILAGTKREKVLHRNVTRATTATDTQKLSSLTRLRVNKQRPRAPHATCLSIVYWVWLFVQSFML